MTAEPARRAQLVDATIHEIGAVGNLNVTVGAIARRAGVSPSLAFHYFGDKEALFLAAMRHVLRLYGAEARGALAAACGPRSRVEGVIRASFSPGNFRHDVVAAWLNFYVLARSSAEARRLLAVYHRRLQSNLVHDLRPLSGAAAPSIARRLAALIDGLYLRHALQPGGDGGAAGGQVLAALDAELRACGIAR